MTSHPVDEVRGEAAQPQQGVKRIDHRELAERQLKLGNNLAESLAADRRNGDGYDKGHEALTRALLALTHTLLIEHQDTEQ